ncbi:MAG: L-histidine N(alpha)-methyltransferase [Candidatus Rokubacteria bacterium]|nr:L-histidine N(alpha)-methyltransferase [Candidatus Rokubacteria bacterium]
MSSPDSVPSPADVAARCRFEVRTDDAAFLAMLAEDVRRGFARRPWSLPPKYFYDDAGAGLFDRITELPEYYLTRVEESLLPAVARAIARDQRPTDIVELGPGSCRKARTLIDAIATAARYVAVDFGRDGLARAVTSLARDYPRLHVHAVVGDFATDLVHVPPPAGRRLALFLGSTIGNFDPEGSRRLLAGIRATLGANGSLLVGVDLVKDRAVLEAAYDDAAGVTREFNRNVLRVINRALGADFVPEAFRHVARYEEATRRIEMHLVAETAQRVRLPGVDMVLDIEPGDDIWTESSYKFTRASTEAMLRDAGLTLEAWYTDDAQRFGLALARPAS